MTYSETLQQRLKAKFVDDIAKAEALGNKYDIDLYGRFPWDRSEHRGKPTNLSKASLGEFCSAVLGCGGEISSFFVFNARYLRSAVFVRVRLSIAQKEKIEAETKYRFDPPPTVHVNSATTSFLSEPGSSGDI
jgi:hypothetical protein